MMENATLKQKTHTHTHNTAQYTHFNHTSETKENFITKLDWTLQSVQNFMLFHRFEKKRSTKTRK